MQPENIYSFAKNMNDLTEQKTVEKRLVNLYKERQRILSLPPEKSLDAILDSPQALPLVHSFPEEDFYLLINDIGIEDSLSLLNMATTKQWEYIFDIETWEKDRIELSSVVKWFDMLINADSKRFMNWMLQEKTEFCEYFLYKNIEVFVREHDQDASVFGDEFFTFDDTYYIRFNEQPGEDKDDTGILERRKDIITRFLEIIADDDHIRYQHILHETSSIIPAETEEEAFRLRNVRLAEKGFLPFHEAIGIYQPLQKENFNRLSPKIMSKNAGTSELLPVSNYPAGMLKENNLFTQSLITIEYNEILQQIQIEFARLCNQIISADQIIIKDSNQLKYIVKKACCFLSIGLQRLTKNQNTASTERSAFLIQTYQLSHIFRMGFGAALELKWRAEKWVAKSWFKEKELPVTFWDEYWTGVLGGILLKKPLFYDNYKTGVLYREFESMEEINESVKQLDQIISVDNILSLMLIDPEEKIKPSPDTFLTFKNYLLTLWARNHLGLSERLEPIGHNEFKHFFIGLFNGSHSGDNPINPETASASGISNLMKELFLKWLSQKTDLADFEITNRLGETLEKMFNEIEDEYGRISINDINPKYITHFLVMK